MANRNDEDGGIGNRFATLKPIAAVNYRRIFTFWCPLIGLLSAFPIATYLLFVEPPPPRTLVIATGEEDGAYFRHANQYAEHLREQGLEVEVRATEGSVDNLNLLLDENSGVSVAIVQGGVAELSGISTDGLEAVGSLYREPLWVFHRREITVDSVPALRGKRVAIGPKGSGTRPIARLVLVANGLADPAEADDGTEYLDLTGRAAGEALLAGEVDALFLVASVDSPAVGTLLHSELVRPLSFDQQEAYEHRYRYLSGVTVPAGLVDLGRRVPPEDVHLIAPAAMLVIRDDLHPALIPVLLEATKREHGRGNLLTEPGVFPTGRYIDLPLNENARRYHKSGPPLLQRYFPFWIADLIDRLKLMVIPVIFILMPIVRALPPVLRWRIRRKVYLWYSLLREIDRRLTEKLTADELRDTLAELYEIEDQVIHIRVPLGYTAELYHLRAHLALSREKALRLAGRAQGESV